MDGLKDYIKWLGRFSFAEMPFCEADALVLCVLSYFDLTPALRDRAEGTVTVADCGPCLVDGAVTLLITGSDLGNSDIFRAAIESRRFGALRITDYEDILRPEVPLQFAAVTFRDDDFAFIAYRGTDETIAGWKEDFMISFTRTEAQRLAGEYAARVMGSGGGRFYLGGHSKGANLALCAAGELDDTAWARVERVFLLDGPGLCPEVMDTTTLTRVDGKATRIVPEFDVVGKLFEPTITDTRIIRSRVSGILEHSLATWGIEYGALALAPEHDRHSVALMQVLNRWIESIGPADRRALTDDLFDSLSAGGAVTLGDVADGGSGGFEAVLVRMFHARPETKKIMMELPAQFVAALRERLRPTDREETL